MFGKYQRRDGSKPSKLPPVRSTRAKAKASHETKGSLRVNPSDQPRVLAKYDQLGQTLVATITVDAVSGPDASELVAELSQKVLLGGATEGGLRHVVFDLQGVTYMDSMCIGVLVEFLTRLRDAGGRIALVNTAHNVEYLFKLTRLDRVFPICRDVMKAIEAVERGG